MSQIDWGYDAGRLGTLSCTLTETGGGGATGAISLTGCYMHTTSLASVIVDDPLTGIPETLDVGYVQFAAALKTALEAVGNATYTVTFDTTTRRYTISAAGGSVTGFTLTSLSDGWTYYTGITSASPAATSFTSSRDVWHFSYSSVGGFSEWTRAELPSDGMQDLIGSDGTVRGVVPVGLAETLDFVVPWEALAKVYNASGGGTAWTWQRAFARCRTVEPMVVLDASIGGTARVVGNMRSDSAVLSPRLASSDYLAHQSIPIGMYVVGRLT